MGRPMTEPSHLKRKKPMKKVDFVNSVVEALGDAKKVTVNKHFDAFCDELSKLLLAGDSFTLPGVGTLKVVEVPERTSYNPAHKQKEVIPAHKRVRFSQSATLTQALKG